MYVTMWLTNCEESLEVFTEDVERVSEGGGGRHGALLQWPEGRVEDVDLQSALTIEHALLCH